MKDRTEKKTKPEKKTKNKKKDSFILLLNPKYLQKEVHAYGYNFSEKAHIGMIFCIILGATAIGLLFKLEVPFIVAISICGIIMLPIMVLDMYKRMYQQKRFEEAGDYMEQIVRAFQKSQKIYTALKECKETFKDGKMRESIQEAIQCMDQSKGAREALEIINKNFECAKIRSTNDFLLNAEEHGGSDDFMDSSNMLIDDNALWVRRGYALHMTKKQQYIEMLLSILFCTLLCAGMLYGLNYLGSVITQMGTVGFDIFAQKLIQITSIVFILFSMFICVRSSHSLSGDWLQINATTNKQLLVDDYTAVINYDEQKSRKKSIIMAAPFLIAVVPVYLFVNKFLCIVLILISLFLLFQHRIGHNIALNAVKQNLGIEIPIWLMDLTLLLQHNTVYVALQKSRENASEIIQLELDKLFEEMEENPGSIEPYNNFMEKFHMPEVASCMKLLYSIAENGTMDKNIQLNNLIESIQKMQERSDEILNERNAFEHRRYFSYPMAVTTIKLALDCTYGMLLALNFIGSVTVIGS